MRMFYDRISGRQIIVPSVRQARAEKNIQALQALGIDYHGLRCACCTRQLTDLANIKVTGEGAIGPECSKPNHPFPCRRHSAA